MKKNIMLFFTFLIITGVCFATDPAEGFWLVIDDRTSEATIGWQIYQEGGKLFGKMLSSTSERNINNCKDSYPGFPIPGRVSEMPIFGTPWVFGLSMERPGVWSGGHIIHPRNGGMFRCKITFRPADGNRFITDTLEVRGEIGLGIGRSMFLRRTNQVTASSLRP